MTSPPRCPPAEIEEELAVLPATAEFGDAVRAWWQAAVRPQWARVRAVLEADIAYRTRQLAEEGIRQVFAHLHPALHWSGDSLVSPDLPSAGPALEGAGITLVPTAFTTRCHLLTGDGSAPPPSSARQGRSARCGSGATSPATDSPACSAAAGPSSRRTPRPPPPRPVAARTGLSLGAVSQHLAVLHEAGLVTSHRYGETPRMPY